VEEVFVRTGAVINLHVPGQVIRTTSEHPFFVYNVGWTGAGALRVGDMLRSHDGCWLPVEDVVDNGEVTTVYNLRVAEYHTYFVGSREWGFSAWAHNAYTKEDLTQPKGEMLTLEMMEGRGAWKRAGRSLGLQPLDSIVYIVRDKNTGEYLKVGETRSWETRYGEYLKRQTLKAVKS